MVQETRIAPNKVNFAKGTNYRLNIHVLPETQFWLTTCNLPTLSSTEVMIPDPVYGNRYVPANTQQVAPMMVTFLVDEDYSNYMEILLSNNYIYIVVTSGDDIKVIQLSDTLSENWSRTLDITGLGYADKLGGATATGFGIDGNGSIAITGSTKNDDDWDGFIVIVDNAGNRIY